MKSNSGVDVVLIGRNEGQRLINALDSVQGKARQIVYVDSGSTDQSIAEAIARGARVVNLDMSEPFSAARARNAGFDALDEPEIVLFLDGDCMLVPGFIEAGRKHLLANPKLGLVTGWRSEIYRDASLYNQLCDWEWRRDAGQILACGGDMMVRAKAWSDAGGMNPAVIASEDEEFCTRLRKAGWILERLPLEMTRHDADMMSFGQWWSRAIRTGHGFAQVGTIHPEYFARERRRVIVYALILPLTAILGLFGMPLVSLLVLFMYVLSYVRTARGLIKKNLPVPESYRHSVLLTLSKFPNMVGMMMFHWRRLRRDQMKIIEYK